MLEKTANHRAKSHHYSDETKSVAETGLNGFDHFGAVHPAGEAESHARDHEREKRVQTDDRIRNRRKPIDPKVKRSSVLPDGIKFAFYNRRQPDVVPWSIFYSGLRRLVGRVP